MSSPTLFLLLLLAGFTGSSARPWAAGPDRDEDADLKREGSSMQRLMEASRPSYGVPYILGREDGFPEVLLNAQSTAFPNVNLIEEETDGSPMQNESSIAANPLNPNYLIASAVDYRDGQSAWVYVSSDGGFHWKNIDLGKPSGLNFVAGNDPSVAWDYEGRAFLVYGGFDAKRATGENGVFISISSDNGKTWNKHIPVILHKGTMTKDSAFEDKYYISVDNASASPYHGHLYMPWKRVIDRDSSTQIVVCKSTDHGLNWSTPIRISDVLTGKSLDTTFGQSFPILSTGPKGEVYVAWNYGPLHSIGFNSSSDGGKTWGSPRLIQNYQWLGTTMNMGSQYNHTLKGGTRVESYPSLVVDTTNSSRRGWLYLSWAADKVPNVYFSRSTDGGQSWSAPRVVHSDTARDQYWQWMALDGTSGDLAIMYLDSRDDASNKLSRCYVSISRDGGSTWTDRAVDDVGFDIRRNPFVGGSTSGVFAGDYSGCAFIAGKVFPSHVDMRNTYPNTGDNDVYSAVININAPLPVSNFKATTIVSAPTTIQLNWTPPTHRAFGEVLTSSEFVQSLYRDSVLVQTLAGTEDQFVDSGLPAYTEHVYRLVVITKTKDSSVDRYATGYAGGSAKPMKGKFVSVRNDTTSALLRVTLPHLRADSVNALVNMALLRIYRDSVKVDEKSVKTTDTSLTLDFSSLVPEPGYYQFQVSVVDAMGNESAWSDAKVAYIGPLRSALVDNFDGAALARYLRRGGWAQTDEFSFSAPQSLTESPRVQYRANARDTLTLFPMRVNATTECSVSFRHAAVVDKGDTAYVEAVLLNAAMEDSLVTVLGAYNRAQYSPWTDNTLSADDWKPEVVKYSVKPGDVVAFRLRFKANVVGFSDGWFIDDLRINSGPVGVSNDETSSLQCYPNPGSDVVHVLAPEARRITVYSMLGTIVHSAVCSQDETSFDVRQWASGMYVVEMESSANVKRTVIQVVH